MKNGLAIWHYPHRSVLENVRFFAEQGCDSVSILGFHMDEICADQTQSKELARLITEKGLTLTVHHKLPRDHSEENVSRFQASVDRFAAWQRKYKCLDILSFDVPEPIRDCITPYVDYVLQTVPFSKIALEDFGLTSGERQQIEHLKSNERFGYLIDIGHMHIRMHGKRHSGETLMINSPDECPATERPTAEDFLRAFRSKEFPIFEIHLHSNDGITDLHYFLDEGILDVQIVADALKEIDYHGILTIESAPGFMFPCVYPESDRRILETYEIWKRCINHI